MKYRNGRFQYDSKDLQDYVCDKEVMQMIKTLNYVIIRNESRCIAANQKRERNPTTQSH